MKKINSILYVEDEKNVQFELAEFLENFCEVLYIADDGFQGLELFTKHSPDIVITDIKMPIMDGIKMSRKIKEISDETPIVFTTAFSDVEYFLEAIELQVEGYILKPINLDALAKKVSSIISTLEVKKELQEKELMLIESSKLAAMGEMIGNIAHQWKQPLSSISASASGMRLDAELGNEISVEDIIDCSKLITNQAEYLANTIDDFKNFFQPRKNNECYNVKTFIDKCINLVSASFSANTIQTIKEIDDKVNSFGDPNKLIQALINILNNAKDALKYAENLREKLIFIFTLTEHDKHIVITIKDNAGGIPQSIMPKIFDPYFTTKEDMNGTGLGLYITKTIITKHLNGTISVENEVFEHEGLEYKGAKFTITLPLK